MRGLEQGGKGGFKDLPMQVLKVGAMAPAGMQSMDAEGLVAGLTSEGKAGISIILICRLSRGVGGVVNHAKHAGESQLTSDSRCIVILGVC